MLAKLSPIHSALRHLNEILRAAMQASFRLRQFSYQEEAAILSTLPSLTSRRLGVQVHVHGPWQDTFAIHHPPSQSWTLL